MHFSHFQWQKRPGSRDCWHFLSGVRKEHVKIRQKESAGPPLTTPREKTRTKRTLGHDLYWEQASQKTRFEEEKGCFRGLFLARLGGEPKKKLTRARSAAQTKPGARHCCHFCQLKCSKSDRSTGLLAFLQLPRPESGPERETVGIFATFNAQNKRNL